MRQKLIFCGYLQSLTEGFIHALSCLCGEDNGIIHKMMVTQEALRYPIVRVNIKLIITNYTAYLNARGAVI
ncbi:hypothetical protein C9426_14825 [Serratia sp. S1B]|nr:hypothetical protein C9426_14825 [Serratia sp. S1B]